MSHISIHMGRLKAIMSCLLLLSSFIAVSVNVRQSTLAQQNMTNIESRQNSNANLTKTLRDQLSQVFSSSTDSTESQSSNYFPVVDADGPATASPGENVTLNGSGTYDPEGNNLSYAWSQDSGKTVAIDDDDRPIAYFTAPSVSQNSIL